MKSLLLTLVLIAPDVEAQADALVREGRLDDAFELLEAEYYKAPEKNPRLLFGMGMIKHKQGDCEEALSYFGRFMATSPADDAAARTKELIQGCEEKVRAPPAADPRPQPEPGPQPQPQPQPDPQPEPRLEASPEPEPDPSPTPKREPVWYRDKAGWGLLASGILVTAAGSGLLAQGALDRKAAKGADDEESFDLRFNRSRVFLGVGGTLTTVGVGLLVGAIIRYAKVGRRPNTLRATVRVGSRSAGVSLSF